MRSISGSSAWRSPRITAGPAISVPSCDHPFLATRPLSSTREPYLYSGSLPTLNGTAYHHNSTLLAPRPPQPLGHWSAKVFALLAASRWRHVLLLDADNTPLADPRVAMLPLMVGPAGGGGGGGANGGSDGGGSTSRVSGVLLWSDAWRGWVGDGAWVELGLDRQAAQVGGAQGPGGCRCLGGRQRVLVCCRMTRRPGVQPRPHQLRALLLPPPHCPMPAAGRRTPCRGTTRRPPRRIPPFLEPPT